MEYTELSNEEIRRRIQEMDSSRVRLEREWKVRRRQGRSEFVQHLKNLIQEQGYALDEIVAQLSKRRRQAGAVEPPLVLVARPYRHYVDPENPDRIYVRGVLPAWMKEKMQAQGYDPSSKDDREAFKKNHMRLVEP